jgi:dTDP-4-amino-4,6-dideoxygalactose transaminase
MPDFDRIPFLDLITPHRELEPELLQVLQQALRSASFIGGPRVESFERDFAEFCEAKYCIGVGSGTDALRFALIAAGVRPGDSVITVPNTFIATTEAISQAGATPEFVDIEERTYCMDPAKLAAYLRNNCHLEQNGTGIRVISNCTGKRVTGIVPVHLYGQMADMDAILALAGEYNLIVIEDACQAHGAQYFSRKHGRWFKAGSMGNAAAFSFYPGKNLGACGEAGAITTNEELLAKMSRQLRDHGQAEKYYHAVEGYNGRLDAIQAGFLAIKLKHLSEWNARRREAAARYNDLFAQSEIQVVTPFEPSWSKAVYHLYVIRCGDRDALRDALEKEGIGTGIHYPIPLHLQKAYASLGYKEGDFVVTEASARQIVSLPMSTTLTKEQQAIVVDRVAGAVSISMTASGLAR